MLRRVIPLVLALAVTGCAPELNWREFTPPESNLRQLFPCRPIRQQRHVDLAGSRRLLVMYVCDAGSASWAQITCPTGGGEDARLVREALWSGAQANLAAAAAASAPGAGGSVPSGISWIRGRSPDGQPRQAALKLVEGAGRVVQAIVIGAGLKEGDVATFLDSVPSFP